jgi:AcrR family transcriptional regulator
MNETEHPTREKIVHSALALFLKGGIHQTSVDEIAYHAGVTRITVYRYFEDKRALALEAYLRIERVFQIGLADLEQNPDAGWEQVLDQIGAGLSALPPGDIGACYDELKRIFPDAYDAIQEVRVASLNGIFNHLFSITEQKGLLREGLNRIIVQAIFEELVINFFDNPEFTGFGLSNVQLFQTMKNILLYGILKTEPLEA